MSSHDPLTYILGTCAAQFGAIAVPLLSPLIIGGLIFGLGTGELEAGSLITVELLVIGITSMVLAPLMVRIPYHLLATAGATALFIGHGFSAQATELSELYGWRILSGLGGGCLMASANAAIAQAKSPVLLYGLAWSASYAITAILAVAMTQTKDVVSYDVVYWWLAATTLLLLPLLWFVPRRGGSASPTPFPRATIGAGCLLVLGITLVGISMMAYYAFLERLAVLINANPPQLGRIIAAAQIGGIIGGLMAAPLVNRFGLMLSLLVVTVLHAIAINLAILTDSVLVLGVAAFSEALLFIIMIPMMLTLSAKLDDKGRWAAIAAGVFTTSTAAGPIIGAALIEGLGYQAIAWLQYLAALPAIYIFVRLSRVSNEDKPETV